MLADKMLLDFNNLCVAHILDSIVVSISACHADDPGSIPGRGVFCPTFLALLFNDNKSEWQIQKNRISSTFFHHIGETM